MKELSIKIASFFLILMFIVSGLTKIFSLGKSESKRLSKKLFNLNINYSELLVFLAGCYEIVSCICILYGIWFNKKLFLNFGSLLLILFTIVVTLIFYTNPFKYLPFLSNLTTLSALFLLPYVCIN